MRKIKRIFVHCTAGSQRQSIEDLKAEFRLKGWKYPGYHYVVDETGGIHQLLAIELVSDTTPRPSTLLTWVALTATANLSTTALQTKRMLSFCCFID